jgi:cell wall-associated NlpC family hydrolase
MPIMRGVNLMGTALMLLLAIVAGGCASSGARPRPRPFPGASMPPVTAPPAETTTVLPPVVDTALNLRGTPYRNGGGDPSGFDCSGFVQWTFNQHGVRLPREVRDQYTVGRDVDLREVRPGDLLFFETVSRGASHVGIAIGGDQFVHAPSSTGVVRVERFTVPYWASRFVGAKRVMATEDTETD